MYVYTCMYHTKCIISTILIQCFCSLSRHLDKPLKFRAEWELRVPERAPGSSYIGAWAAVAWSLLGSVGRGCLHDSGFYWPMCGNFIEHVWKYKDYMELLTGSSWVFLSFWGVLNNPFGLTTVIKCNLLLIGFNEHFLSDYALCAGIVVKVNGGLHNRPFWPLNKPRLFSAPIS